MSANRKRLLEVTICAVLTAMSVIIGILCKNLFTFGVYYRVTFENLPVIICGLMFGPFYGAACGCMADILSCVLSTNPAVNPLITLGACAVGVISGLFSKRLINGKGKSTVFFAAGLSHAAGQVVIKSVAKMIVFGMPWLGMLIGAAISLLVCCIESAIICRLLLGQGLLTKYCGGYNNE